MCPSSKLLDRRDFLLRFVQKSSFTIRRCYEVSCKSTRGRTNNLLKQRHESFQSMIESDSCQIDSNIHHPRTESRLRAPGPNDVIERLILILSRTQYTLFQEIPLGKRSENWLYERTQILWNLWSVLGWFHIIRTIEFESDPVGKTDGHDADHQK